MNEILKELTVQACDEYPNDWPKAMERFAELVVKECAKPVARDFVLWKHIVENRLNKHFGFDHYKDDYK